MDKEKNSILIVDDDPMSIAVLHRILSPLYTLYSTNDSKEAVKKALEHQPDLILLDIVMPDVDGYQVLNDLKATVGIKHIPVVFISGLNSDEAEEKALALDAADYIGKPFKETIVTLRVKHQIKIVNALRTIELLSRTDQLTGLPNRRAFSSRLKADWYSAIRGKTAVSLIMADIDMFKKYNDTYGHVQGDVALKTVAKCMTDHIRRKTDMVARWGGEEFAILLPMTTQKGATLVAEDIRKEIESTIIPSAGPDHSVTISLGVNTITPTNDCIIDDFISGADEALYDAKGKGRNRTCVLGETE